jgi:hypothetical protein
MLKLLLNVLVVIISLLIDNQLIKFSLYILLFIALLMMNKEMKPDFVILIKKIVDKVKP